MMSKFDLTGKVALITGGNGGIGRAIASDMAQAGSDIVIVDQNMGNLTEIVKETGNLDRRCKGIECDVTNSDDITATVETAEKEFGRLDILVNAAGVTGGGPPQSISEEEWDRIIDINLKASFRFCQAVYPAFVKTGAGRIINIGSIYSILGSSVAVHYSASKGGIVQMTKSLALSWANENIHVNAILPGFVRTPMTAAIREDQAFYQSIIERTPTGRLAEPGDISPTAVFLASSASGFITGQSIVVDGGYSVS